MSPQEISGLVMAALGLVFAGGGLWTWLAAKAAARGAEKLAATADWTGLMGYWQAEVKEIRSSHRDMEVRLLFLEREREEDRRHIEMLEKHIWEGRPPPPPARQKRTPPTEEGP